MYNMDRLILADLYRYNSDSNILKGFLTTGFRYSFFLRKASKHKRYSIVGVFYRFFLYKLSIKFGFQISPDCKIGEGLYIGHFGTIVINKNAIIGKNCNLAHNITIGRTNRGKSKGCPKIGDFVWIGTGSVIVENIKIGDNVLVAPNTFVNRDVPSNSIELGNPAKIISNINATKDYINNILQ